ALLAIQRLRENPRDGSLADATRAGEEIRVMHAPRIQRVRQCLDDVLLPDQFIELLRAPFAGENLIAHGDDLWATTHCAKSRRRDQAHAVEARMQRSRIREPCKSAPGIPPQGGCIRAGSPRFALCAFPVPVILRSPPRATARFGEVSERSKEHAWKVCVSG